MEFLEAKSKLEAVARISALTSSGPESLGPGSKERKSVLINLARGLNLSHLNVGSKQEIANALARHLNVNWTPACESVGQTITLKGLNLLLEAATHQMRSMNSGVSRNSIQSEVNLISDIVTANTPKRMDGMSAITEMHNAEYAKWRETEWQGFYFEFKVIPALINVLGGGPTKIGNTQFDYALTYPWDMKVHSSLTNQGKKSPGVCPLNDGISMEKAIRDSGLGLIVLNGIPNYDWEFTNWFKELRGNNQSEPRRPLKKNFTPQSIDFFFIPNNERFEEAILRKEFAIFKQGRQASGQSRKYKYSLNLKLAKKSDLLVNTIDIK